MNEWIVLFQQMFDWFWKGLRQTFSFATSVHCGKFWPHFCWVSVDVVAQRSAPSQSHLYLSPFDHPQTECSSNGLRKHFFNFEIFALFEDIYCQDNAELISVDKQFGQACSGQQRWMSNRMNGTRSKRRPETNPSIRALSSSIFFICLQCDCIQTQKSKMTEGL